MGNAAGGGLEHEPAEGREARNSVSAASAMNDSAPTLQKKQPPQPKLPMPPEKELEERFNTVLVSESMKRHAPLLDMKSCRFCTKFWFVYVRAIAQVSKGLRGSQKTRIKSAFILHCYIVKVITQVWKWLVCHSLEIYFALI